MKSELSQEARRLYGSGKTATIFELGGEFILRRQPTINSIAQRCYDIALRRGKTSRDCTHIDTFFGIFDELREFRESSEHRPSSHLPTYKQAQEELADIVIAGLTELHRRGVDVEKIITDKIKFNETRE